MLLKKFNVSLILNYTILLYAFLLPFSRAGINIMGGVLFLLWLLEGNFKNKLKLNATYKTIFLLFAFMVLSYLWSNDYGYANFYTIKYLHYFLLSYIIWTSLKQEFLDKVLTSFISGIFVSEIISYSIFFGFYHKIGVLSSDPTPFMHHIEYSFYLVIATIILIDRFFTQKKWNKEKIFSLLFFTTISFNLFIINGRTGQFVYIIILFVMMITYFKLNLKTIIVSLLVGGIGFLFLYKFSPNFHNKFDRSLEMFDKTISPCSSEGTRVYMIKIGSDIFIHNPIIGVGIGDTMEVYNKYLDSKYSYAKCSWSFSHLHNQYIQEMVQLGIVGISLLLAIFYFLFKEAQDKKFAFLMILAIMLSFMGDVLFSRQFSIALITLMIPLILKKETNEYKYSYNSIK